MALRLNIDRVTTDTPDWTCKVQIVDMSRERESPEKKIRFQNLILEDEEEQQIRVVVYGDDIAHYAAKLTLSEKYMISAARVRVSPTTYGRPMHKFYWVLDRETIVEHIKPTDELEKPLPPSTKLNITTFDRIAQLTPATATEIDILGVVLRCGPPKYAGRVQNRCREITITDKHRNQFLVTLWEDFGELEGSEIQAKMEKDEFPVILGRNIGISSYQGLSLQTRFNSTIRIDPAYPQALELIIWAKTNKDMLLHYVRDNLPSGSFGPLMVTSVSQQVIPIAEIPSQTSIGVFHVEAEMLISNDLQKFCVLECSGCKQKKRTRDRRDFDCPKCERQTTLVPRCTFQIDLTDGSGSTTALISGDLGEKMLSMTAEHIFETTCVKNQLLPINHVHQMLSNKLFRLQLKKSSWRSSNVTYTTLSVLSYTEKKQILPLSTTEKNAKKVKPLDASEVEIQAPTDGSESSSRGLKIQPTTPAKHV